MTLKNIPDTGDETCACGTWLDHWKNGSGEAIPTYCPAIDCLKKDLVGAHVRKVGDTTAYIVPLCKTHNADTGTFDVPDHTTLVLATCGKKK